MDQISVAIITPSVFYFPFWVAQERGFFAREGIELQLVNQGTADKVSSAVLTGETQLALAAPEAVIADVRGGGPLRLIAGVANAPPFSMIALKGIRSIAELRGKRVGTSSLSEGTAVMVQAILGKHGLNYPGDYEFALVGAHPQRWVCLQEGTIDAALQPIPLTYIAEDAGFSRLAELRDYVPDYAVIAIVANSRWSEANRELVVRTLRAVRDATVWADENREAAAGILAPIVNTTPTYALKSINDLMDGGVTPRDLAIVPAGLEAVFQTMKAIQFVPPDATLDYSAVVDGSFLADL